MRRHAVGLVINPDIQAIRDLIYLMISQFGSKLVGFFAFAFLARVLTTDGYGILETMLAYAGIAALVVEFGFGSAAVQYRARHAGTPEATGVIAVVPALRSFLAVVCSGVLVLVGLFFVTDRNAQMLAFVIAAALMLHPWNQEWLLQSLGRVRSIAIAQFLRISLFAGLVLLIVRDDGDLVWVGVAELVAVSGWIAFHTVVRLKSGFPLSLSLSPDIAKPLFRAASPLGLNALLWSVIQFMPTILIGIVADASAVAFYAAVQRLVTSLQSVSFPYHFNLFAALSRRYVEAPEKMVKLSMASLRLVSWAVIGPAAACTLCAGPILSFVYGARFAEAGPVLSILIFAVPLQFISGHHRWALVAAGKSKAVLRAGICGAVVSVLGCIIFGSMAGAVGGAVAAVLAGMAILLSSERSCKRHGIPLPLGRSVLVPLGSAAFASAVALALADQIFVQLCLMAFIYLCLMYSFERRKLFINLKEIASSKGSIGSD